MSDFGGDEGLVMKVGEEKEVGKQGLKKKLLKEGEGWETPKLGDEGAAHFTYSFLNGAKIYSSHDHGEPYKFKIGQGKIEVFDEAIKTMKKGENSLFTIPAELAYGASGLPRIIPPNATLQFDITLLSWNTSSASYIDGGMFKKILKEGENSENPKDPDEVLVKYEACLDDGTVVSKSEGVRFVVKDGYFCPAMAKAVKTMKKAEKVHLRVKPQYGFGEKGRSAIGEEGAVPPNALICIEIELVSWRAVTVVGNDKKIFKRGVLEEEEDLECAKDAAPAEGTAIESKFRRAYAKAFRSVVTVVAVGSSNQEKNFCAGFVLLKSLTSIFVMTATFLVDRQCEINVHFSDNTVMAAKLMLKGSQFSVLMISQTPQINICQPVSFRNEVARHEDAMILATVTCEPSFSVIDGSIIQQSCLGRNKRKKLVEECDKYFITSCPFNNSGNLRNNTLMSAAVFDIDGYGIGFIIANCSSTLSGRILKRVMHAEHIDNVIRTMKCVSFATEFLTMEGGWKNVLLSLEKKESEKKPRVIRKFRTKRSGE